MYGRYLGSLLSEGVLAGGKRRLQWKKDEARALFPRGAGEIEIQLRSGARILADKVVLALGNFPSSDPLLPWRDPANRPHALPHPLFADPCFPNPCFPNPYFPDPWSDTAFEAVEHLDSILLLGSGLSGVDVAVELRRRGFQGTIHFLSRHGQLPHSHKLHAPWPAFWNEHSPKSARGLLRLVRDQVRKAAQQGVDWRGVITSLRQATPRIWQSLPEEEKRRFLRHVRPYWEVHRHRAAPETAQLIDGQRLSGNIQLHAGRVTLYRENGRTAEITFRERKNGEESCLSVDRVINCTAPETDCRCLKDPLMTTLLAQGVVRPDPLFLGLDVSADGALNSQDGIISDSLYVIGPARKGSLWESTAVPEIRDQVYKLVEHFVNASGSAITLTLPLAMKIFAISQTSKSHS